MPQCRPMASWGWSMLPAAGGGPVEGAPCPRALPTRPPGPALPGARPPRGPHGPRFSSSSLPSGHPYLATGELCRSSHLWTPNTQPAQPKGASVTVGTVCTVSKQQAQAAGGRKPPSLPPGPESCWPAPRVHPSRRPTKGRMTAGLGHTKAPTTFRRSLQKAAGWRGLRRGRDLPEQRSRLCICNDIRGHEDEWLEGGEQGPGGHRRTR